MAKTSTTTTTTTTIVVDTPTKARLDNLGAFKDSYRDVIKRLLDSYEFCQAHHKRRNRHTDGHQSTRPAQPGPGDPAA